MTKLAPERSRGRYHGLHMLTWSIGMLVGPVLGTLIHSRSEKLLWSACAVSGVAAAMLLLLKTPESRATAPEVASTTPR